jgi:hypothetical protein
VCPAKLTRGNRFASHVFLVEADNEIMLVRYYVSAMTPTSAGMLRSECRFQL